MGEWSCRHGPYHIRLEEIVDPALCLGPLAKDKPAVKNPCVQVLIPLPDLGCQRRIVLHGKVQTQTVPVFRLLDPCGVEPMVRPGWIAVKPKSATGHRTSSTGLLHKRPRHQRHLVQQDSGKGDALDQPRGAFIPAAKDIEPVFPSAKTHGHQIFRTFFLPACSQSLQSWQDLRQNIAP